jgi:uncharacterized protein (TIGR04255 family)
VAVTTHPSYPNPIIVEAVCEVQFELSKENPWKASLFGDFYKNVQGEFPEMEPLQGVGVQLELGPQGLGQKLLPQRQRMRFKHAERPLLLQLDETSLIVNVLAPYPGWDKVVHDIMDAWRHTTQVLLPSAVTQVGLRYINRIELSSSKDRPKEWIRPNDYVATGVLDSRPGFLSRAEAHTTEYDTTTVTLGYQPSDDSNGYGAIIFDIDRITQRGLSVKEDDLEREVNRLHEDVWLVFTSAKSEKLEAHLQGAQL